MSDKFILDADGKTPIPCDDTLTWARWFESASRVVRQDSVRLPSGVTVTVSTVFLGLDHSFGHGDPILWETMIFGGDHDGYQQRYSTYKDAFAGHAHAYALARETAKCSGSCYSEFEAGRETCSLHNQKAPR